MSSLFGHALAGAITGLAVVPSARGTRLVLSLCVMAAVLPDLDYLGLWWFDHALQPRFTHSLLFCAVVAGALWLTTHRWVVPVARGRLLIALLLASVSHPLLDLLVGAHAVPLLWPSSSPGVSLPFGLLPSAGSMNLDNVYFWRNLLIEAGLFGPVLAIVAARRCNASRRLQWAVMTAAVPVFAVFLVWSMQLVR